MQNFVHLVLSRFNVQIFDQAQPCSDEWMTKRFDLYLKYSKKSMMSQDCSNYKWVIFLDSGTSDYWVNRFHADLPGVQL